MGKNKGKKAQEETAVIGDAMEVEDPELERKKMKKEKKKRKLEEALHQQQQAEQEEPETAVEEAGEDDEERQRQEKKARKAAKRLKKQQQEANGSAATEQATPVEADHVEETEEEARKRRKQEKKEKKRLKALAAAEAAAEPHAAPADVVEEDSPASSNGHAPAAWDRPYKQHPETAKLTDKQVQAFWEANEICISGEGSAAFKPVLEFRHSGFPSDLLACTKGFAKPTPIQCQCWPVLSSGRDIIGIAETGSGKTLTFALPGILAIKRTMLKEAKGKGGNKAKPRMLVLAPTRELAMQSAEVIEKVVEKVQLTSTCLFGGVPKVDQKKVLRRGVDVIIATPGRLVDLMEEGECDLSDVTYLVLDEADRMLDQGFEQAIRGIIACTAPGSVRQTALFSATWPQSIQQLAQEFLNNPIKVTIGGEDLSSNKRVQQIVEVVDEKDRDRRLKALLEKYHGDQKTRVLVFALYKKEAARLETSLQRQGWNCVAIHGDKGQNDRIRAVNCFKSGEIPLLVATDVAARGLDIPGVDYVINYSFPLTIEDYIHRIGRTGRAGKTGISHTFFHQGDKGHAGALANVLRQAEQPVPADLEKFGTHVKKKEHKLYGAFAKDVDLTKKATKIVFADDDE